VHLGERNCSVQRRHQKLIEESPSPGIDAALRENICAAALQGVKHIGYFECGNDGIFCWTSRATFYFMEINARIQVEHPVTEMVTGVDLIKEQFKIAMGEPLVPARCNPQQGLGDRMPHQCRGSGHEFSSMPRSYRNPFLPDGPGVRVDTHIHAGYEIPIYYDTLLAKLIVHAKTRHEAVAKMSRCLDEFIISPTSTTISFHKKVLRDADFIEGRYDTDFVSRYLEVSTSKMRTIEHI